MLQPQGNPPRAKNEPPFSVGIPHTEGDHYAFPDGTLICICACLRCWPNEGGPCPDERGPR